MLYSVPGRTAVELSAATCAKLAGRHANIVGIKEAGGRAERVTEIRLACGPGFVIHSGDDALTLPFLSLGAQGVTSVASNFVPAEMVSLYEAWKAGEADRALDIHDRLFGLIKALFVESNPVPVKAALALRGAMSCEVRRPLAPLMPSSAAELKQCVSAFAREV
jgi:4-hydroxy-tetrahydrodipicolinate synthase